MAKALNDQETQRMAWNDDLVIVHEGGSLNEKLPPEILEEWKSQPQFKGKFVEFMKDLLASEKLTDVTFILQGDDSEKKVKAHKCMLSKKSEFFSTAFSTRWDQDVIDLRNCGVGATDFKTFLEYLYVGQTNVTPDNVMTLYHLANMYLVGNDQLKEKCEAFLKDHINDENVFTLLNHVFPHVNPFGGRNEMIEGIIDFICSAGESMLDRVEFQRLDMAKLSRIFSTGKLKCSKFTLLRFCLGWIKYHCGRKALTDWKEVDRRLREDFRVCSTSDKDFPRLTLGSNPTAPQDPNQTFKFNRFPSVAFGKTWTYRRRHVDRVSFRVSEPIILTGLGFYGDADFSRKKYDIDVVIYEHGKPHKEILHVLRSGGGTDLSPSRTFKVNIHPCFIHSDTWYTLAVHISGDPSFAGEKGSAALLLRCGLIPIVVEFKEASIKDANYLFTNATGVRMGQIPEMYFKIAEDDGDDDIIAL